MSESAILKDFRNCLYVIWKFLGLPPPTPIQYEIAEFLQHGDRRQIIEGYRGVGKSWITSGYVLFSLKRDPQSKFLVVSASKARADDFSTFTMRLMREMPLFQDLLPRDDQRNSKLAFDVAPAIPAHAPSVKSAGVFGQMTGSRATHIIADDVEIPTNSETQDKREKLLNAVSEFEAIIMHEVGRITFLGTPQTEESIYNKLRQRGYTCRIWPSRVPSQNKLHVYEGCLAPSIAEIAEKHPERSWQPTDPQRFTDMELMEREASIGRSSYSLQFMLDTSLSDSERYPLKLSDCIVTAINPEKAPVLVQWASSKEQQIDNLPNIGFSGDRWYKPLYLDKEWANFEGAVMSIDPSGRGKDETAYAVVKILHGYLFLTRSGGFKDGYTDAVLTSLARIAQEEKVNNIVIEANFGDGMFTRIFTPILNRFHKCAVEEVKHSIQKEKRIIDTLEPVLNRHRMVVDIDLIKGDLKVAEETPEYSLFYQLTRITKDRGALMHDDRLDALAIAVSYWVDAMGRDEVSALEDFKTRELRKQLEEFVDGIMNGNTLSNTVQPSNLANNWLLGGRRGSSLENRRF